MKYSILLLGASISISFFLRICCAVEVNSVENIGFVSVSELDALHPSSRRADEVYERFLKFTMKGGGVGRIGTLSDSDHHDIDDIVDGWLAEMKESKKDKPKFTSSILKARGPKIPQKLEVVTTMRRWDFESQYCGLPIPPNLTYFDGDNSNNNFITSQELPEGCEYNEAASYMRCKDGDVTDIPPLPQELKVLDLDATKILKIPPLAIRDVSINTIRLHRNSIDFIDPWAFHDVDNLTTLMIVNNEITFLAYEIYVGLNSTLILDLSNNRISLEIYKHCALRPLDEIMPVLPKLRMLKFTGNPLKVIPKQMFAGLRRSPVVGLYLNNCYLSEIHPDAFSFLPNLEILDLSGNYPELMTSLALILEPLTMLKSLYLANNRLMQVPTETLSNVAEQLQVLDLSGSLITSLKRGDVSNLVALEELYMDSSGLLSIDDDAFQDNLNLKILSLKNNKLRQVPSTFPPNLEHLFLSSTHDTIISSNPLSFKNLTKLEILDIEGVKMEKITTATFTNLPALRSLFISRSQVKEIDTGAFKDLSRLRVLKIANNPTLSTLNPEAFAGMERLEDLNLANCSIRFPAASTNDNESFIAFPNIPLLKKIDLSGNQIDYLMPIFQNLPNLTNIILSRNPIKSWKSRIFPEKTATVYDRTLELYYFTFELAQGDIQFLTDAMIQDFLRMSLVDLSNNKFVCDEGACKLRDLIHTSLSSYKQEWANSEKYECFDTVTNSNYPIHNLTDEICQGKEAVYPDRPTHENDNDGQKILKSPSGLTKIISICASLTVIMCVVILLAYRNRVHLRYFMFVVKFNVLQTPQRKAKLSTREDSEGISFNYDVFISYHRQDSKFVEEVFLPEIEIKESKWDTTENEENLSEAKNSIYFIDNDKKNLIRGSNNIKINMIPSDVMEDKLRNVQRFRVCLHERDFAAGVPITENIVDCVDRSRKTVIFVSRKYMESQWCSFEMNLAYHRLVESRRKAFLLVLMEEIPQEERSKVLNYLMVSKTYLQWPGRNGPEEDKAVFWRRLRSFLQSPV